MADLMSILSSNYVTVGSNTNLSGARYVNVDPEKFEGSWKGKYANNQPFEIQVSNVNGFRARVKYQSGSTTRYQDVLIRDNSFRVGDSKFMLTKVGTAKVSTVMQTASGSTLENAFAKQNV